jgi:dimethylhistidine N-methyltransferase
MSKLANALLLDDRRPSAVDIRSDVLAGLRLTPKRLSSKYFYDDAGSALFELICEQPEYYLTRAELAIMRAHAGEIARTLGPDVLLMEYGSGSGAKTRILLSHLDNPVAYVPIEISPSALLDSATALSLNFPDLQILPLCADFTDPVAVPKPARPARRRIVYFPGSTLGNFDTRQALSLLRQMAEQIGSCGAALVGIDLKKDSAQIEAAYNDAAGVTAQFTLNMLARFNRELEANFDLSRFRHRARYNPMAGRIETHVVSCAEQQVVVAGECIRFAEAEGMLVEISCKYSLAEFAALADKAGLVVGRFWTDPQQRFSVQYLLRKN